ncbi:phosphonate ABC transporter ATP-binding protein [Agrobacterium sp. NPDC090283]|uniref:phosphonate ABC transporter ATP-binding protein n=1 Tax=Agrobacterium sp. NPDC090283 TaxID=3363920 RepID=UPI00383B9CAE
MLELYSIKKTFGQTNAVDDVTITVDAGQMVGIIGRSGAGKSTLLRLVNRLIEPTNGRIMFDGRDITRLRGRDLRLWRASCAMIFQQFNLVERMDVLTNVLIGRIAHQGVFPTVARRFTEEETAMAVQALARLDLLPQALQKAGTLSGGQQQRVAIAKALVQRPEIMLADEPIASLDPANATRVMEALRRINREDRITVLVNLHTLDTARAYCDRIIAMRFGRVVFEGTPAELTRERLNSIYGDEGGEFELDETVTSTAIRAPAENESRQAAMA